MKGLNPFATKPQQEEPKPNATVIRTKHVVDLKSVRANSAPPSATPPTTKPEQKVAPAPKPTTSKRAVVKPRVVKTIKIKKAVKPTPQLNTVVPATVSGATQSAICNPIPKTSPSVPTPQRYVSLFSITHDPLKPQKSHLYLLQLHSKSNIFSPTVPPIPN